MVKQRMSSADVAAEVACLRQRILGLRVANIYDLTAKTYVMKLARSGEDGEKVYLMLESGARFHTTKVLREKTSELPSNFTLKLRKHCRTRRVEAVRQLGVDRCMELTLGSGPAAVHLILEMYAQGNIVLTDHRYEVLTLLRSHRDDAKGLIIMARHPYPMQAMRLAQRLTAAQLDAAAPAASTFKALLSAVLPYGPTIAEHVVMDAGLDPNAAVQLVPAPEGAAAAAAASEAVAAADGGADGGGGGVGLGGGGEEEEEPDGGAAATADAAAAATLARSGVLSDDVRQALLAALGRLDEWFARLEAGEVPRGYITLTPPGSSAKANKKKDKAAAKTPPAAAAITAAAPPALDAAAAAAATAAGELVFAEFNPLPLLPYGSQPCLELPTFDDALDEFFSKVEGQRVDIARADAERAAMSRLDKIKLDQGSRAEALLRQAQDCELKAELITYNLEAVDAALAAVNQSLATGMDWSDLEALIREERKAGNPVAGLIASLELGDNCATLLLANSLDEQGEDGNEEAMTRKAVKVSVDLSLSAHANASAYFDTRRRHMAKHAKTLAANEAALAAAEKKAEAQIKQVRNAPSALQPVRKPMWFERFHWFVSSENYLVVSGRDAQQNELLVKRYFRRGDVYVHAELHGASSTIIKNPAPDQPIPPLTLQQAGCACMCRSRAWDSKIVTSAWWVHHHQVSKTAPTGEYLTTGSFMIRGKKNFLPPQPLVMGFGYLFKLDDSSIPGHLGERAVRGMDPDAASTVMGPAGRVYGGAAATTAAGSDIEEEVEIPDDEPSEEADGGGGVNGAGWDGGLTQQAVASAATRRAGAATAGAAPSPLDRFLEGSYDMPYGAAAPSAAAAAAFERYGLSHVAEDGGEDEDEGAGAGAGAGAVGPSGSGRGGSGGGRRHLSAKERALLKKQGGGGAAAVAVAAAATTSGGGGEDEEYTIVASEGPTESQAGTKGGAKAGGGGGGGGKVGGGAAASGAKVAAAGGAKGAAIAVGGGAARGPASSTAGGGPSAGKFSAAGGGKGGLGQTPQLGQHGAKGGGKGGAVAGFGKGAAAAAATAALAPAASAQRGKKGKQAKLKDKYADQDEEERALALAVLGSAGDKKTRADRQKERKERKEAARQETRAGLMGDEEDRLQAIERATGKQFARSGGDAGPLNEDEESEGDDEQGGKPGVREARPAEDGGAGPATAAALGGAGGGAAAGGTAEGGEEEEEEEEVAEPMEGATEAEKAEIAALLAEENVEAPLADEEAARLSVLDSLTGLPRAEDVLLFAVPVCGPYLAIQSYKYKVKVTPGTVKKGKAARQAIELLTRGSEVTQRERDILRAVPDMEAINALVGPGVKLSMPGLQKMKADDKKSKKAKAQAPCANAQRSFTFRLALGACSETCQYAAGFPAGRVSQGLRAPEAKRPLELRLIACRQS